jgi:fructokinase
VWAGGTFGNVLAALRFLGWHGKPFARLGGDSAGELIVQDLTAIGVETSFVEREDGARTPVILHRIRRVAGGGRAHGFGWACPKCGERYPSFRPVLSGRAAELTGNLVGSAVFFFDRVSRSALDLAQAAYQAGAAVVFEPSARTEPDAFEEALQWTDVINTTASGWRGCERLGFAA